MTTVHNAQTLSRRNALAGLAALSVGTMSVAAVRAAGTGSDAELLKLDRELDPVSENLADAYRRSQLSHDVAEANMPPLPEVARVTTADRRLLPRPWSRKEPDFFTLGDLHDLKRYHLAHSTRTDGVVHDGIDRSADARPR